MSGCKASDSRTDRCPYKPRVGKNVLQEVSLAVFVGHLLSAFAP